jgi:hypothetical protein
MPSRMTGARPTLRDDAAPFIGLDDVFGFRAQAGDDVNGRMQHRVEHALEVLPGLIPIGEGIAATPVELVLVFEDGFPEMAGRVDDERVIACVHRPLNAFDEGGVLEGRLQVEHVKVELLAVEGGRAVFGVDEGDLAIGTDQPPRQTQGRVGLAAASRAGDGEFDLRLSAFRFLEHKVNF